MQVSGSVDMQFCFSILFFVLLTAWLTYWAMSRRQSPVAGRRSAADSPEGYVAELERLKREEKEG